MTAYQKNLSVMTDLNRRGIPATVADASILRRAERVLHKWAEAECGSGNDFCSYHIERDDTTQKPYMVTIPHRGEPYRKPIADREAGALKRVAATCKALGVHFYQQTDPRGCALYVAAEPLTPENYPNGVAVSA